MQQMEVMESMAAEADQLDRQSEHDEQDRHSEHSDHDQNAADPEGSLFIFVLNRLPVLTLNFRYFLTSIFYQ